MVIERVAEHRCRFVERNSMHLQVEVGFARVPFEFEGHSQTLLDEKSLGYRHNG
jgi:hypothetical protein